MRIVWMMPVPQTVWLNVFCNYIRGVTASYARDGCLELLEPRGGHVSLIHVAQVRNRLHGVRKPLRVWELRMVMPRSGHLGLARPFAKCLSCTGLVLSFWARCAVVNCGAARGRLRLRPVRASSSFDGHVRAQ